MIGARYRTDSETTDEQCIPESISEAHDSAVDDLVDDSDIAEDDDETDNDKSPNCDMMVNVPSLPINLEVQSSTESDKTVLSIKHDTLSSVPNSPFSSSPRSSSHNIRQKLTLNLPEIIVQPCSPPPTSPSAESTPTTNPEVGTACSSNNVKKESSSSTTSSSSSISLGPLIMMATGSGSTSSSSFASMLRKAKAGRPIKSTSVPPMATGLSTSDSLTCMEYEQLNFIPINNCHKKATSAPMSASSSRSESPMSDRYCGKCSSLISLHLRTLESDSGLEFFTKTASTQTRPQSKGKSKPNRRPNSKKTSRCSLEKTEATAQAAAAAAAAT